MNAVIVPITRAKYPVDPDTLDRVSSEMLELSAQVEMRARALLDMANVALARMDALTTLSKCRPISRRQAREMGLTGDCVRLVAGWNVHGQGFRWLEVETPDAA